MSTSPQISLVAIFANNVFFSAGTILQLLSTVSAGDLSDVSDISDVSDVSSFPKSEEENVKLVNAQLDYS